jgi:uncharacterized protein (DUF983 family)
MRFVNPSRMRAKQRPTNKGAKPGLSARGSVNPSWKASSGCCARCTDKKFFMGFLAGNQIFLISRTFA